MACLIEETVKRWISDDDWTSLENKLGGWHAGEQVHTSQHRLGPKLVERLHCSVCTSVKRLFIKMLTKSILVLIKLKIA